MRRFVLAVLIVGMVNLSAVGCGANTGPKTQSDVKLTGTCTSQANVGQNVLWTLTATNDGTTDFANLKLSIPDWGGLDLISCSPEPVKSNNYWFPEFGPLRAGESKTITFTLLAKKTGVAKTIITLDGEDSGPAFQTIVR